MELEPGRTLLHYRLVEKIGQGGMGVVWKAVDESLGREVAIKMLPAALSTDADLMLRFEREARVLASLSHANIGAIYGLHEAEGARFIVLELIAGEDLSDKLKRGPLPVEDAATVARRIGDALCAAHDSGVIHRDLKPSNVKITPDGDVKVLDFGLAKALTDESDRADSSAPSMSPTITSLGTRAGMILGTAAYMSPEQAKGQPVDRRADTWAFGCVLFELVSGKRAFQADTIPETLAAVLRGEPDWDALPATTPAPVRRLLERCLTKDPRGRLRDVGDACMLLDEALSPQAQEDSSPTASSSPRRERIAWVLVALLIVVAAGLKLSGEPNVVEPRVPTRFDVTLTGASRLSFIDRPIVTVSPDGRRLAFIALDPEAGADRIFVREFDRTETWSLPGTEDASVPFFSPDGTQIGFFAEGKLKKVGVGGGAPISLTDAANMRGAAWLSDDTIVYSPGYSSGLMRIPADGGAPHSVVDPDDTKSERTYRWVDALADGSGVVYTVGYQDSPNEYDGANIMVHRLDGSHTGMLVEKAHMARVLGPDRLIFLRKGTLYLQRFDPDGLEPTGPAVPVQEGVGGDPSSGAGYFDISHTGTLVFIPGSVSDADARLAVVDDQGAVEHLPLEPRGFYQPRFSPDGKRIVFTEGQGQVGADGDVWVYGIETQQLDRLTFSGRDLVPVWEPGGERITFARYGDGGGIFSKLADGSEEEQRVVPQETRFNAIPSSWSPDGQTLAFTWVDDETNIFLVDRDSGEPVLFERDASSPTFSPDGRYLAYTSPAAGNTQVFIREVTGGGKWQISRGRGGYPRWAHDGGVLFYIATGSRERSLMAIEIGVGDTLRVGSPRVALPEPSQDYVTATAPVNNWDISPDGKKAVFVELQRAADAAGRIEVVLDWSAAF